MSKQYSLFIGRWQPWHPGHRWLINQRLNEGKNVWVAIRDVEPNEKQPWTSQEVLENVSEELHDLLNEGKVFISIVPDIMRHLVLGSSGQIGSHLVEYLKSKGEQVY
jgi:nicotinamide mononucleotide adenylyltransferase